MALEVAVDNLPNATEFGSQLFGVSSPMPMVIVLATYILIIYKIGPSYMKSRPAYQLKTFMVVYNILQVIACIYIVFKIYVINLPTLQFWVCVSFQPETAVARDYNTIGVFTFWLKVFELSETVVFVLRKKQRQISFLHVFHHCATLFLVYHLLNSYKGSSGLFPLFLNCNVHIVMYCYYLMAAILPPNIVATLTPFKKAITKMQLIQFVMILTQTVYLLSRGCPVPRVIVTIYIAVICAFFYMFFDFYKKNYSVAEVKKET